MRKIFLLIAVISAALFIYGVIHLSQNLGTTWQVPSLQMKGFEENNSGGDFGRVDQLYHDKIKAYNQKADRDQTLYFWMSFLVTILTAASTLVSSIQAAKKDVTPPPTRTFAYLVATITFCSTLANFASSHFNDLKTEERKRATELVSTRNQFFLEYSKASPDTKATVIQTYERKLD